MLVGAVILSTYILEYCQLCCLHKSASLLKDYVLEPITVRGSQEIKHLGAIYKFG